ncbi:hypothetical protein ACIBHX_09100 [Nonomuraea sp. NPDC050536]|uniref:hypothetical protein n=1 Tax=Nonomuraea sp. NPDC050536 TaxID=3364366 RepID=UPI0037C85435
MRSLAGFRDFVREHEHDLVTTALQLTGTRESAERLAAAALRDVGLTWPPPPWPTPAAHARHALYRRFLATTTIPLAERHRRLAAVADAPAASPQPVAPGFADRVLRSVRSRRLGRVLVPAAVLVCVAIAAPPVWDHVRPAAPVSMPPDFATPTPRPAAWKIPRTEFTIRFAVPDECRSDVGPAAAGTVTCSGWVLHLGGEKHQKSGDLPFRSCSETCWSNVRIPDAARWVAADDGSMWNLEPALSSDGRRVAYLSAVERRYVAADLSTGTKVYLTPELAPGDLRESSFVVADGRDFTVSVRGERRRVDSTTGASSPVSEPHAKVGDRYDDSAVAPGGRLAAALDTERGGNGGLDFIDARKGRVLRRVELPTLGSAASSSELISWADDERVVIRMTSENDLLGWFTVSAKTGRLTRIPNIPDIRDLILGKA